MSLMKAVYVWFLLMFSTLVCAEASRPPEVLTLCSHCHGESGEAAIPGWPKIAGMSKSELVGKLKGHRQGLIPDSKMADVAAQLSDQQIEAIAEYFSQQK